jgi:acetoin utilization protein AcuB
MVCRRTASPHVCSEGTLGAPLDSMLMPPISRYMTRQPWTIRKTARLPEAHGLMRAHDVRHLPVVEGGKVVGMVSERDLYLLERLIGGDPETTIEDAMTSHVFAVSCEEAVDAVVEVMAEHKYGSAVILDRGGGVAGIFTTVDGMRMLASVLQRATA